MDPQRSQTLDGEDLIKKYQKGKHKEVKWRKTTWGSQNRCHCCLDCRSFCRLIFVPFLLGDDTTRRQKKLLDMTFTKLPGFSIVITLSFQSVLIMGETFLAPEANKDSGLKIAEKRTNNFRVPMEMPYDPNFWPARGRRSRREPEKATQSDDCITEDGYIFDKSKIQCQDGVKIHEEKPPANGKLPPLAFELIPPIDLGDELLTGIDKTDSSCCGNGGTASGQTKTRLGVKIPAVIDPNLVSPKRLDEIRHKKQKHTLLPQLIFYGNGVYWEPENLFGEKKKKQDVFWVARGKKYFNLSYPQK